MKTIERQPTALLEKEVERLGIDIANQSRKISQVKNGACPGKIYDALQSHKKELEEVIEKVRVLFEVVIKEDLEASLKRVQSPELDLQTEDTRGGVEKTLDKNIEGLFDKK